MVNGAAVPVIHKQGVSKAQRQQVQYRLFTQIMVDTVNLALFEILAHLVINFPGGFQRGTERFFHHHTRRLGIQLRFAQAFADSAERAWRHREVVNGDAVFLIQHIAQTRKTAGIVDIKITEVQTTAQGIP